MSYHPDNELFSAYLDGELTAEEEAQVERVLASSPAARQLLDELRNLSQTLQTLPAQKLAEDLSPHVLRVAERRMLAESPLPAARTAPRGSAFPWALLWSRLRQPRVLVWSGLAVAIALVIRLHDAPQQRAAPAPPEEVVASSVVASAEATVATAAPAIEAAPAPEAVTRMEAAPTTPEAAPVVTVLSSPSSPPALVEMAAPSEPPVSSLQAGSSAPETGPVPAGEPARVVPPAPAAPATPAGATHERPWIVRGELSAEAVEQRLLEKLLVEQKIAQSVDDAAHKAEVKPSAKERIVRMQLVATGAQLKGLLAAMQEQDEAFSALALDAPGVPAATAAPSARQATAGSVVIEKRSTDSRKPAAKSRVLFDRDAPPPPPPAEPELELPPGDPSSSHTIFVELHVVPAAR